MRFKHDLEAVRHSHPALRRRILLLIGELITGLFSVEGQMAIGQGETVNYVQRTHELELAITDSSDPAGEEVVAVPMHCSGRAARSTTTPCRSTSRS